MKFLLSFFIVVSSLCAEENNTLLLNMDDVCRQFREQYNDVPKICLQDSNNPKVKEVNLTGPDKKTWKIKFYFGFTRTKYLPTTLNFKNHRMDIAIKDFVFDERPSSGFYNPKNWETAQDAMRWIDEPTNTMTLLFENNDNQFFLRVYHPKFLKELRYFSDTPDKKYLVQGTIDGQAVDQYMKLDPSYEEYVANNEIQINLLTIKNTHQQLEFALGYGKKMQIVNMRKWGELTFTPDIAVGVMIGQTRTAIREGTEYWMYSSFEDKLSIHGFSVALSNRIEWSFPKFRIFADARYHYAKIKHKVDATGGEAHYNLPLVGTTVGIGINLWSGKKKK